MKTFSLFLPGEYDDAFIYMGRLLAFTSDRRVRIWSLDKIAENLTKSLPSLGQLPALLFARNDYLNEGGFKRITSSASVLEAILRQLSGFPQPHAEIRKDSFDQEIDFRIPADSLLNVLVYGRRLYVGTESGLFDINVDWHRSGSIELSSAEKRLESRCVYTTGKFGAILASCVDDGLWTATQELNVVEARRSAFKQVPERSVRTSWLAGDLANYKSSSEVNLLTNHFAELVSGETRKLLESRENRLLTDIGVQKIDINVLYDTLRSKFDVSREDIQFLYNDNRVFFAHTYLGKLFAAGLDQLNMNSVNFKEPRLRFIRESTAQPQTVISASPLKSGVVFETDSEVAVLSEDNWTPIVRAGALSVRTFPMSRRSQNLVVSTLSAGIQVTALFPYRKSTDL